MTQQNIFMKTSLGIFLSLSLTLTGCGVEKKEKGSAEQVVRFLWSEQAGTQPQIKVMNALGEPVAQAHILIGMAENSPFRGNFIDTNNEGIALIPKEWNAPAHVTVDADGYIRQTLLDQKPGDIVLRLNKAYLSRPAQVTGQVTNLPVTNGDKLIDFGLVMPALSKADILNFDLDQVISPYTDVLSVAGQQAPLPSNVSLPTQKENYIFNLTVSKPIYRLLTPTLGAKRFFAARGRFPFKPVVDELRAGKPFYELLNYFSILGGGLRDVNVLNANTNLDIPGNELEFKNSLQVQTANTNSDEVLVMLAASQVADTMIPTDVKKAAGSQSITLTSLASQPAFVVSVVKKQSEFMAKTPGADRMSASIMPYVAGVKQTLLPLVADPSIRSSDGLVITFPQAPNVPGINSLASSVVISDLIENQNGDSKIISTNRRWEVLGLGWSKEVQLPLWPLSNQTAKKRVEINFLGTTSNQSVNLDDSLIQAATHVTHASSDF